MSREFCDLIEKPYHLSCLKFRYVHTKYASRHSAETFTGFIAKAEQQKIREKFKEAKFLALLSDGSTDKAVIEQEIVYCRFAIEGIIHSHYLSLVDKPDAESIYSSIKASAKKILGES